MSTYTPDEMLIVLGFTVSIDHAGTGSDPDSAWETCSGGGLNIECADASVGSDQSHTTTPGHKSVDTVTLRGPLTSGRKALCQWINDTVQGRDWKRNVTVTELVDRGGRPVPGRTATFFECFPVRYRFPVVETAGGRRIYEELEFAVSRVEYA